MLRTVAGDIQKIGGSVLAHEHLRIDLSAGKGATVVIGPEDEDDVVADLIHVRRHHGLDLLVDLTVLGSGRDLPALREIARKTEVAIIGATGFYWDIFPPIVSESSREALAERMIGEIVEGFERTGIRCGVIKVGTPAGRPDATARRLFQAAADASQATGAAIVAHTSSLDQAEWQIETFLECGVEPSRLLISHFGRAPLARIVEVGRHGTFLGIDQIGFESGPSFAALAKLVHDACLEGLGEQIIVSSDMARRSRLTRHGGTSYGTVFTHFLPELRALGTAQSQIEKLTRDNPVRLFEIAR